MYGKQLSIFNLHQKEVLGHAAGRSTRGSLVVV